MTNILAINPYNDEDHQRITTINQEADTALQAAMNAVLHIQSLYEHMTPDEVTYMQGIEVELSWQINTMKQLMDDMSSEAEANLENYQDMVRVAQDFQQQRDLALSELQNVVVNTTRQQLRERLARFLQIDYDFDQQKAEWLAEMFVGQTWFDTPHSLDADLREVLHKIAEDFWQQAAESPEILAYHEDGDAE